MTTRRGYIKAEELIGKERTNFDPDLLAFDLYGDSSLWWVFAIRNPNAIQDPIYDFQPGVIIYVPQKQNLTTALGL